MDSFQENESKKAKHVLIAVFFIIFIIAASAGAFFYFKQIKNSGGEKDVDLFADFSKLIINAAYADDNFELIPSASDSLGVEPNSIYILKSKEPLDENLVRENLVIEPEIEYDLKKINNTEWQIVPKEPIDSDTILKISLETSYVEGNGEQKSRDYSWAFQIKDSFKVIHSIPRDTGTSVPTNSGVEITFSYDNFKDYEKYFEISPKANGRFEKHGRTLVFVPEKLESSKVYTVTVKRGLPLEGSDEVLTSDYTISFETVLEKSNNSYYNDYFYIYNRFLEIGSNEAPLVQVSTNQNAGEEVGVAVYKYSNADDFLKVLQERDKLPWWSYSKDDFKADLNNLLKISEFKTEIKNDNNIKYLEFPGALEKGFYIFDIKKGEKEDQVWAQISDLAVYLNITKTDSIFWVNNVVSDSPVRGASIRLLGSGENYLTNEKGIAEFKTSSRILENQNNYDSNEKLYFQVNQGDNTLFLPASALSRGYWYYSNYSDGDDYWKYLYTDRPRYQSTDTIKYWGMLKERSGKEINNEDVTISLYKQGYVDYFYRPVKIAENKVEFTNFDTFIGEIKLKDIRPDYYTLELKIGDKVVETKYIEIRPYIKPAYNLELIPDRSVAFTGEKINLVGKASFFEGTPVPGLDLIYNTPGGEKKVTTNDKGEVYLEYTENYKRCSSEYYCWPNYEYVSIRPENSELSEIDAQASLKFYGPKIYLTNEVGYPEKGVAEIKIKSKLVDLKSVFNSNWWERDLGKEPAPYTKIKGTVTKTTYTKVEGDTRYDFINKRSYKIYNYIRNDEVIDNFEIETGKNGDYTYRTNIEPETSYKVILTAYDKDGKEAQYSHYLYYYDGGSLRHYYTGQYNYYHFELEGGDKKYFVGEYVTAKFLNDEDPMPDGKEKFLYLQMQNGLQEYSVADNFEYKFKFEGRDIPNVNLAGIYFNGRTYASTRTGYGEQSVQYDNSNSGLKIYLDSDKESYVPGQELNLSVKVTDINDRPIATEVNLNLVDEAYYAIIEDEADPLTQIYQNVSSGSLFSESTHESVGDKTPGAEKGGCFAAGTKILMANGSQKNIEDIEIGDMIKTFDNPIDMNLNSGEVREIFEHTVGSYMIINNDLKVTPEHVIYANGRFQEAGRLKIGDWMLNSEGRKIFVTSIGAKDEIIKVYNFIVDPQHTYFANDYYVHNEKGGGVREFFTDAAFFESVKTDSSGKATAKIKLPDNITSWRVTAQAISKDLKAGTVTAKIPVSLPVFEDVTIGNEYLTNDKPVLKLRAFGTELNKNDKVSFTVKAPSMGVEKTEALSALAFEPTYFTMPDLKQGKHEIIYELKTEKGDDAVKLPLNVIDSRLEASFANSEKLTTETKIVSVDNKPVAVILLDWGQNMLYQPLLNLSWIWGDRVDQIIARSESRKLLEKYYNYKIVPPDFTASNYQVLSGGLTLLPYSSEDLELSARVAAIGASGFDKESLAQYFFGILENNNSNREEISLSLFGLASLQEPVLPRIYSWLERDDLGAKEKIYLAQALFDLGDKEKSREMYYGIINEYAQEKSPEIIIKVSDNQDAVFQATALTAVLATSLNADEAWGLWNYLANNQVLWGKYKNSENLFNLEKLNFISHTLPNLKPSPVKIRYEFFGKEEVIELTGGKTHSFYLDPSQVNEVKFLEVEGDAGISTVYVKPINLEELSKDADIQIKREYYVNGIKTNNFKENDTIEVRLYPDFGAEALKDFYQITDILPSGLMPVTNLYTSNRSYDCHYWYPYNTDGQKVKFRIHKDWKNDYCGGNYISYYARVKNIGEYKAEPAIMQSFTNPDYVNYSDAVNVKVIK